MAGFHNADGSRFNAGDFTSSGNISVASAAAAGTKGAWTQVLAAANNVQDSDSLIVLLNWLTAARIALVDIGIGAAAAETVVVPDLLIEQATLINNNASVFHLPVQIPSGTRIAARANISGATTKSLGVTVIPVAASYLGAMELSQVTAYGVATTPAGTSVDPGAVANTKGAYSQIVASTTYDMKAIIVVLAQNRTPAAAHDSRVDIAVGAAASEKIVIPDLYTGTNSTSGSTRNPNVYGPYPCDIPAGTRLAARAQGSLTTATDRLLDVAVYGLA